MDRERRGFVVGVGKFATATLRSSRHVIVSPSNHDSLFRMPPTWITVEPDAFADRGALFLADIIRSCIAEKGRCVIGLSGGKTPAPIYELLGQDKTIDWSKVTIFLVDDRDTKSDAPRSNQYLLRTTLLKHAPIPESQIILPDTSLPLSERMDLYARHLAPLKEKIDLLVLGIGEDGHIASLFPPLADEALGPKAVIHTTTDRFDVHNRLSTTLPFLKKAKQTVFFLQGEKKKQTWEEMMKGMEDERRWPAKGILRTVETTVMITQ